MNEPASLLMYAIRGPVILKYSAQLVLVQAGLVILPVLALFEVVPVLAAVGLSSGITRADLQPVLKLVLSFDMLAGRLEIVALLVFLYPKTWFGRRVREL
ncbi:potassium transporter TrkG [Methylobacter luteus]|uniref:potassium transporter TrkG n=1 Tax=Methylobacter luteus TaxID=415 RepID=UPI000402C1F3|nr:potassium transporter TrkG [Methylobacter luteus]